MLRLQNSLIGIERGDAIQFSHYEDGGPMWSGAGEREVSKIIAFTEPFRAPPLVQVFLTMWDMDNAAFGRADVSAEAITRSNFRAVFKTWGDTRVARARVGWLAMGELVHPDDWELY